MNVTIIENTPFACVQMKDDEQKFVIVIGNAIASPKTFDSVADAKKYVNQKTWELLGTTIMMLCDKMIEQKIIEIKDAQESNKLTNNKR